MHTVKGPGMKKFWLTLPIMGLLGAATARAGLFDGGIGGAMYYGPYTGGHPYSYNTAYGYGFAFSPADTWPDLLAYPAGIYPYRPYGQPIYYRTFPDVGRPYIAVPGPDGLPVLVPTPARLPVRPLPPGRFPRCNPYRAVLPPGCRRRSASAFRKAPRCGSTRKRPSRQARIASSSRRRSPRARRSSTACAAKWNEGGREVEQYRVVGVRRRTAASRFPAVRP